MNKKAQVLKQFGNNLREERLKKRLSQKQLAEKAGVHRTYVGMIERAEKNITLRNIQKVAEALGLPISDLFNF